MLPQQHMSACRPCAGLVVGVLGGPAASFTGGNTAATTVQQQEQASTAVLVRLPKMRLLLLHMSYTNKLSKTSRRTPAADRTLFATRHEGTFYALLHNDNAGTGTVTVPTPQGSLFAFVMSVGSSMLSLWAARQMSISILAPPLQLQTRFGGQSIPDKRGNFEA